MYYTILNYCRQHYVTLYSTKSNKLSLNEAALTLTDDLLG